MMRAKSRRWINWLILIFMVGSVFAVIALPTFRQLIIGIARGEAFYRWLPTSYWASAIVIDKYGLIRPMPFEQHLPQPVINTIRPWLFSPHPDEAHRRVLQLHSADQLAVPVFTELLRHPDQVVQCVAIRRLGEMGEWAAPAVPQLADCLWHRYQVEEDTVIALNRLGPVARKVLPAIKTYMNAPLGPKDSYYNSRWPRVAGAAMILSIAPTDPDFLQPLLDAAREDNSKDPRLQYQAIEILGSIGPRAKPIVPKLIEIIRSEVEAFRVERALNALRRIDPEVAATIKKADR